RAVGGGRSRSCHVVHPRAASMAGGDPMNVAFAFPLSQIYLWAGLALALVVVVLIVLNRQDRFRKLRLDLLVESKLAHRLLAGWDERLRRPLNWLTLVGFASALLAL